jgi:4-amino-4-deoxy-L-arabinose transferase-like glycosyltransferase
MTDSKTPPPPANSLWAKTKDWRFRNPYWTLVLLTFATLSPFLAKPFNMDDPLYIWAAQQIQLHPGNPYGFNVNWYGITQTMWSATQNPPLFSYYLAAAATLFGWDEVVLHFACLLPTLAVVLGTYRLAKDICRWPMLAALATLFAPGFLISSTTVMSDVPMLGLWVWAVIFWLDGVKQVNFWKLFVAGLLTGFAVLTKYNAICLIPLLAACGWLEKRTVGRWVFFLLIPVLLLVANEWFTFRLYGHPHFLNSNQYAKAAMATYGVPKFFKTLNTLTFIGGCSAAALFFTPFVWRKKALAWLALAALALTILAVAGGMMAKNYSWITGNAGLYVEIQIFLWAFAGLSLLGMACADVWRNRDAASGLLALWILGIFVFAACVYWTVNGRVVLPLVPAAGILIARRLGQTNLTLTPGIKLSLLLTAVLSLLAAQVDFEQARVARRSAEQMSVKYANATGKVWFEGHWGFQYYMQSCGAWPYDFNHPEIKSGDLLIIPAENSNVDGPDPSKATKLEVVQFPISPWLATWSSKAGASFYSTDGGPLPFAFGSISPERIFVFGWK